jgi:hypothetical protein
MKRTDSLTRRPYLLRVDSEGFIRPSARHSQPDLSILFLGGSTTECRFVDEEDRFPYLSAVHLEERTASHINSYNGGVSGSHTMHLIEALLVKGLPMRPQVAVLSENSNDLATQLHLGGYWTRQTGRALLFDARPQGEAERVTGRVLLRTFRDAVALHTYARVRSLLAPPADLGLDEFAEVRGRAQPFNRDDAVRSYSASLRTFVAICRAWRIQPVLMTQANRFTDHPDPVVRMPAMDLGLDYPAFKGHYDAFNDEIRHVSTEQRVLLIDLAREIPPEATYLYDAVHYNGAGSRLAAAAVARALQPIVLELAARRRSTSERIVRNP